VVLVDVVLPTLVVVVGPIVVVVVGGRVVVVVVGRTVEVVEVVVGRTPTVAAGLLRGRGRVVAEEEAPAERLLGRLVADGATA
jgi:hypothetical protein